MKKEFGLIGYPLKNNFSKDYFTKKLNTLNLPFTYTNFELPEIENVKDLFLAEPNLIGLNVTIPYKETVIKYLNKLDVTALVVGAVNCIKINNGIKIGYNTDTIGFKQSFIPFIEPILTKNPSALVLGYGGAAKAVCYALKELKINFKIVSRNGAFTYKDLTHQVLTEHKIIINCTPLGMHPEINIMPDIPYKYLTPEHYCFDLIYLPAETLFLKNAAQQGAKTKNGLQMLYLQAEAAWQIWSL